MDQNVKAICLKLFGLIGSSRNQNTVCAVIKKLGSLDNRIKDYIDSHIMPKLKFISKAYIGNVFTCGYYTSSIAESANNRIKSQINSRSMTLLEMRLLVDRITEQQKINDQYVKSRKLHKANDPKIIELIATFNISLRIAEAVVGSFRKAERLKCEKKGSEYLIKEDIITDDKTTTRTETYTVSGNHCTCNKFEQSGLPCSHFISTIIFEKKDLSSIPISQRWIIDKEATSLIDDIQIKALKGEYCYHHDLAPSSQVTSKNGRFLLIMSESHELATLGSRSSADFDYVINRLKDIIEKLETGKSIVEDVGTRPGRKPSKRRGRK